jgi:hypothetical protein
MAKPEQPKLDFDISVSTKLPGSEVQDLDTWADANFSDRSKLLRAVIRKFYTSVKEQGGFDQSLGDVINRLTLRPV